MNHPLLSAFEAGLSYRGQAVTTDGDYGTASLDLGKDPNRQGAPWTSTLSLDFTESGGSQVNFPSMFMQGGGQYSGQVEQDSMGNRLEYAYFLSFFPYEGAAGQTGSRQIAGNFRRFHQGQSQSCPICAGNRANDLHGAFAVTPVP